jgi:hypothetical protein
MIDHTYNEELYLIKEKTTVILSDPWEKIGDADRQLLQKILQSVRPSLASVKIVYQPKPEFASFQRAIYFGAPDVKTEGTVVVAPSLSALQNDPAGKQKLWVALKTLFAL